MLCFFIKQELILEGVYESLRLTVAFLVLGHHMELFQLLELLQWLRASTQLVKTAKKPTCYELNTVS